MAGEKIAEGYIELRARMSKFESQLKSAEVMTGKSVSKMQAKFKALAPTFRKVGIGMAVAGGAITAALGLTIKSAIDFNKEMANIATLIPGATKRVIELKGAIRTMAVDVGKSTADLAQGAYQVISAFGDTADTVAILEMSAKAATAGVAGTTEAINLLSAVTKGYGDTSKEAVKKASDLAFQTVTLGQTTFPELAASIGLVIPLTAELGVSQEELFAVMATGTGVTGKAAQVATQLRGIMQALMSPTADMTILFADMGFRSGKAMLAERGLAGSLEIIKSVAEASNTPLQKYIGSIEGQTLALALTGTQADTYIRKLAAMRDSVGLTDIAFREQTEGINKAGFAFEQAKIRISVLGQEIGDRLLPMITPLIEKVTDLIKKMSDWGKAHSGISTAIVKFMAVLGPLLIGLGGLLVVLPGLVALAPMVGAAFHIMLGPIGLITIAIAAAVAAFLYFYKTNKRFATFVNNIGAWMKALAQNIWNHLVWIKDNWGKIWKTIYQAQAMVTKNAFDNLITLFKWIGSFISGWGKWLGANFFNVWKNMFSAVSTGLENFGTNIVAQLGWLGKKMNPKNWFKKVERPDWTPIFEGFEAVWTEMPKIAELSLKKLTTGIKNFMEPLPELVKPVLKVIKEEAKEVTVAIESMTTATSSYITTYDELLKLRGRDKELTEEEKKRIKELEEVQKAAQEEIARLRKMSFEEWQAQNEARTKELYDELDKQKKIQKDAKDEIVKIRKMSFEDWQKKNEARTKELYNELATQKQIQKDAKSKIADIRKMSFEDWKKKNEARTKELYEELAKQKQIQKDAKDKIINIRKMSFQDWQKKNEARTKELYEELAKQKQIQQDAKDKIIDIRKMSFEDWQKKNEARTKELYAELAVQKQIEKDAKDEIANIRKMSFEEWKANNEARTKELYEELATQKQIEQDAKDEIANIRKMSFEEWKTKNEARTKELFDELTKQEQIEQNAKDEIATIRAMSFEDWKKKNEEKTKKFYEELAKQKSIWEEFTEAVRAMWGRMAESAAEYFSKMENWLTDLVNAFADVISGTKTLGEALLSLAFAIPGIGGLIKAFWELGKAIVDAFTGATQKAKDLEYAIDHISRNTETLGEAFKDIGTSLTGSINDAERAIKSLIQTQEELAMSTREKLIKELDNYYDYRVLREMDLTALLALSAETREKLEKGTLESIAETAEEVAEREKDAKIGTLAAIEEAYAKESVLIDKKIKLIEIEIKLLMAAALAEQGKLKEAEKLRTEAMVSLNRLLYTEEELAEKIRDTREALLIWGKTGTKSARDIRKATEDTTRAIRDYGRAGKRSADDVRSAFGRTRRQIEDLEDSTDSARIGIEDWGREGRRNADKIRVGIDNARIGIELWGDEINKIPRRIDFDIVGHLDMPEIPRIGDQSFNIRGIYAAPNIPSYQVGTPFIPRTMPVIVHREEAILNPSQAREWRAGGTGGGTQITYERGAIRMTVMGGINQQVDLEEAMDYLARKQAREMEKV